MNRGRLLAFVALLSALFAGALTLPGAGENLVVLLSDGGQLGASGTAVRTSVSVGVAEQPVARPGHHTCMPSSPMPTCAGRW